MGQDTSASSLHPGASSVMDVVAAPCSGAAGVQILLCSIAPLPWPGQVGPVKAQLLQEKNINAKFQDGLEK